MPQLLSHLNLNHKDTNALDWGTVVFYTCSVHCDKANGGYAEEYCVWQNFSKQGMGDDIREELAKRDK